MEKYLYLECASGISGDMTVAALLDLGASREKMDTALKSLGVDGFSYTISQKKSYSIAGCDFDVQLHDEHHHTHSHEHEHHHEHRNLADVNAIIDRGNMTPAARALAKKIFRIVAEAESRAHACQIDEVHFHEVGALDSIADIVAAAVLLDDLAIGECIVPALTEGCGFVKCQHGALPIPVPAVLNIAQAHGIALRQSNTQGEMVTPTGIAIAAAIRTSTNLPENYRIEKIGIGLGKRDFGRANILRAMIVSEATGTQKNCEKAGEIFLLESNIDDSTGEQLGLAMDALFAAGARDVHFMPCFMKKNRPAWLLRVVADAAHVPAMEETIFRTTTTIGIRKFPAERTCMEREFISAKLSCGNVQMKRCRAGTLVRCYPEYESVKALSEKTGVPFTEIFAEAKRVAETLAKA